MERKTRIAPMSAKRRALLAAEGDVHPSSTLGGGKAKSASKRAGLGRGRDTGPSRAVAEKVAEREGWGCVVCGKFLDGPRGSAWSVHHRVRRPHGIDNSLPNLLAICGGRDVSGCHQIVHSSPAKARKGGWLLRSTDDPAKCKVATVLYGWVLLCADGSVAEAAESGVVS